MGRQRIPVTKIQTRLEFPDDVVNPDVYKGAFMKTKVFMRRRIPPNPVRA